MEGRRRGEREDGLTCRRNTGERYDGVALLRFAYGSEGQSSYTTAICAEQRQEEPVRSGHYRVLWLALVPVVMATVPCPAELPTSLAVSTLCPGAVDSRFSAPLIVDRPTSHRAAFSFCLDYTHKANLHLPWAASTTIAACPVGQDDSYV
jgi:hypothetical protein